MPSVHAVLLALLVCVVYHLTVGIYNVYFHPLAKFPGPRLAAFSNWWRVYVEVFSDENLTDKLFNLHSIYGDIVRIAPNRLHFAKPSVYHEIYNSRVKWDKDAELYRSFAEEQNSFTTVEHREAKKRREPLLKVFARKSILEAQSVIQEQVDKMLSVIEEQSRSGQATNIFNAFRCFTFDVIALFSFATSMNALGKPNFEDSFTLALYEGAQVHNAFRHFPLFKRVMNSIPVSVMEFLNPIMKGFVEIRAFVRNELLSRDENRMQFSVQYLCDEAGTLIAAGTDTASNALSLGAIHVLANREIYRNLKVELKEAWPSLSVRPTLQTLEKLPYLTGVVKEALRLSHGVLSQMTRVVPEQGDIISDTFIPGGTIVAIANCFVHLNSDLFPDPHVFKPERWLMKDEDSRDDWLVAFSKGRRNCPAIHLAYCEMYLMFAGLFRRFDMELDGCGPADLQWKEAFVPILRTNTLNIRATAETS